MANPNNAVGTNGAFGGRTSVNAFNDVANFWTRGRVSGWECSPKSGLTVQLGGVSGFRDVALAQDPSGNKTTVNNISGAPVEITLNAAPASNSRVDAIVAYIEDSPNGSGETDNPDVVNLLVVSGTVAAIPTQPTDSTIRIAITADGASGSTAYYVVLACVTISAGTTDIDATMITQGEWAQLSNDHILDGAITADKVDFTTFKTSVGLPTAKTTIANAGADAVLNLYRIGGIVYANGTFLSSGIGQYDQIPIRSIVPAGFRPSTAACDSNGDICLPFTSTVFASGGAETTGGWTINNNGGMKLSNAVGFSDNTRFMYNACWPTDDEWPS